MHIGLMRAQISVERRSTAQDDLGQQSTAWNSVGLAWAHIEHLSGNELLAAQATHAEVTHRVTIRYFPGLTAKDRFVYTDPDGIVHYYNVLAVTDVDMRHRFLECQANEGLAQG